MNQSLFNDLSQVMQEAVGTGLFISSISIQAPDGLQGPSGAASGNFVDVVGLQNIPCMDAPESWGPSFAVGENKAQTQVESSAMRHVLLDQYYPQFSPMTNWDDIGWQAIVDGVAYDILGAEADSQRTQTRVFLRKVTL